MSSNLLERLRRRVGFQLSLWFVLLFLLSSVALFVLTYYLLAAAIQNRERILLEGRLKDAASLYQNGGVSALQEWVQNQPPKLQSMSQAPERPQRGRLHQSRHGRPRLVVPTLLSLHQPDSHFVFDSVA